jgi:hypothetical protein
MQIEALFGRARGSGTSSVMPNNATMQSRFAIDRGCD